jgi:hypothetical protein
MFDSHAAVVEGLTQVVGQDTAALGEDALLDRLATISALESVLAAAKQETMVGFHHALAGTSADLGHDAPRPRDRAAGHAERRWSGDVLRSVSDEVGLVLSAHRKTAARWINRAAVLVERFAATHALLAKGGLPVAAAQHIAHELAVVVDDELRAAVEQVVLAWGQRYGWVRIKQVARREAAKVVAEYDSLLHGQRHAERTTYMQSHDGGIADLVVSTTAMDIAAIMKVLTDRAIELRRKGDARSLDELRTDIAVARLLGADQATAAGADKGDAAGADEGEAAGGDEGEAAGGDEGDAATAADQRGNASATDATNGGRSDDDSVACGDDRPADADADADASNSSGVDATSDDSAHAGQGDEPVPPVSGLNPAVGVEVVIHCTFEEAAALASGAISTGGDLEGYGPLPQDALALAFRRAKFRYRLTDREPVSDPARHDPSPGLAQHVRDRDRRCRFPGCNSPAVHCDLDHRVAFPEGATDAHNLEPLCRHHHRLKHLGDWQVFNTDDGTLIWISPTGRAYFDPPALPRAA